MVSTSDSASPAALTSLPRRVMPMGLAAGSGSASVVRDTVACFCASRPPSSVGRGASFEVESERWGAGAVLGDAFDQVSAMAVSKPMSARIERVFCIVATKVAHSVASDSRPSLGHFQGIVQSAQRSGPRVQAIALRLLNRSLADQAIGEELALPLQCLLGQRVHLDRGGRSESAHLTSLCASGRLGEAPYSVSPDVEQVEVLHDPLA